MFREVAPTVDFPALERDVLRFWRERRAFETLVARNRGRAIWSFLDGPITANNPMAVHHAWGRTYKDLFQRFKAMQGYDQRYQNGFDCQGLWVEVEVEKELGFTSKRDIEAFGIARFVEACQERVRRYARVQTEQSIRLGYWMDWDHSYYTMSDENNYTIWLFLKRCHQRGLIYRGQDAMPWCPRCSTGLSHHEIMTEGYGELTHLSVFLRLPLLAAEREGESLLVWTTTSWTLAANVVAAVHPDLSYVRIRAGGETLYVARDALQRAVQGPYEVLDEVPGAALVGLRYRGPFDDLPAAQQVGAPAAHRVVAARWVTAGEGTGIVHVAPGCGKEDWALAQELSLPAVAPLDEFGHFLAGFGFLSGRAAHDVAPAVIEAMKDRGLLYRAEPYTHRYPVCWRCGTPLLFRLVDEWFISMDGPRGGTEADAPPLREQIMDVARKIRWLPPWGLERELDWLRNMDDWMISKKRYWGLALPIWACDSCGWFDVVGGEEELAQRAIAGWQEFQGHTPHRPWIDAVKLACQRCGAQASRVSDVGNPWLDAGVVPFSTLHYCDDRAYWEQWFPADFIVESFPGQFRNWFYSLLTMSTVLENREPFRAVLGHGMVRDERGEEMHKSKGNAIGFDDEAERAGASVMRWIFAAANPEQNLHYGARQAEEVKRRLLTLWNVYAFFCTYARLEGFDPTRVSVDPAERSVLDRWVLAELHALVGEATRRYEEFDAAAVARRIEGFVDDLSTWYVRRGRARYWKHAQDQDKVAAFLTLWEVLTVLARVLAPSMPFLAEAMYQNLVRSVDAGAPESVHHTSWPEANPALVDAPLRERMALARHVVGLGRAARARARLKVRQPAAALLVRLKTPAERRAVEALADLVLDELNVKRLEFVEDAGKLVTYLIKPNLRLLSPMFGQRVNAVARALQAASAADLARLHAAGEPAQVVVDGLKVSVPAEDFDVETVAAEGFAVVDGAGYTVALDVRLTPELMEEGWAREIAHRLNGMRKDAGFQLDDRIVASYRADGALGPVFQRFAGYIRQETLSQELEALETPAPPAGAHAAQVTLGGETVLLAVRRAAGQTS